MTKKIDNSDISSWDKFDGLKVDDPIFFVEIPSGEVIRSHVYRVEGERTFKKIWTGYDVCIVGSKYGGMAVCKPTPYLYDAIPFNRGSFDKSVDFIPFVEYDAAKKFTYALNRDLRIEELEEELRVLKAEKQFIEDYNRRR